MSTTIIECALNGPWSRAAQPLIPITIAECIADGVACARAGASILHVHPYDEATGKQRDDWEIYARIIEGIWRKWMCRCIPPFRWARRASAP